MNLNILQSLSLFSGFTQEEIQLLVKAQHGQIRRYSKGLMIAAAGDTPSQCGCIITGSVGSGSGQLSSNGLIQLSALTHEILHHDLIAEDDTQIYFFSVPEYSSGDEYVPALQAAFLLRLSAQIASSRQALDDRLQAVLPRTVRERVLNYLHQQALVRNTTNFDIPIFRSEMASYLSVDRTVLSTELARMQKEGLIRFHLNHFELL